MRSTSALILIGGAIGVALAFAKIATAFMGPLPFFGIDVLAGVIVGVLAARDPARAWRWMTAIAIPLVSLVLFINFLAYRSGASAGGWWRISMGFTIAATAVGAWVGSKLSGRRQ